MSSESDAKEPTNAEIKGKLNEIIQGFNQERTRGDKQEKELIQLRNDMHSLSQEAGKAGAIAMLRGMGIPVDDNGNPVQPQQQPQQAPPQGQPQGGYVPPVNIFKMFDKDTIVALKEFAIGLSDIAKSIGLIHSEASDEIAMMQLMNRKQFDQWNAQLVRRILGEAISLTSNRFHIQIGEPQQEAANLVHEMVS